MIARNSRLRARVARNVAAKCNPLMIGRMDRPVDTETAVFHWRTGHLNKEGLLCTRWLSDPSPTTRSFDRTSLSFSLSLSLSLSFSLCSSRVAVQHEHAVDSLVNKRARLYLLVTSSSESRLSRSMPAIRPTPSSRRFTRFDGKKSRRIRMIAAA